MTGFEKEAHQTQITISQELAKANKLKKIELRMLIIIERNSFQPQDRDYLKEQIDKI